MKRIDKYWYSVNRVATTLRPLSWLFCFIVGMRRMAYRLRLLHSYRCKVPIIVVGNITVGGTGKTPLVVWLVELLRVQGYRPAVISRGYGGHAHHWPQQVRPDSDPYVVGDEPLLIAQRTRVPMAAGPNRVDDAHALQQFTDCDIIVSDDGMQHYRLRRSLEIAVIDGGRRYGNGYCLPAGPLREPVSRLSRVDFVVTNGGEAAVGEYRMDVSGDTLRQLRDDQRSEPASAWKGRKVHAVAAIGNPQRFFDTLREHGLEIIEHTFSDHYAYRADDIRFDDQLPVVMTEKDAVKCRRYADERHWYLPVSAQLQDGFAEQVMLRLKEKTRG